MTRRLATLAAACLMVSRIRYPHFFNQLFRGRKTRRHVIQIVFAVAVVFWMLIGACRAPVVQVRVAVW